MAHKSPRGTVRKHVFLREGDFEYLQSRFPTIGASIVIRSKVSAYVDVLRTEPEPSATDVQALLKEVSNA